MYIKKATITDVQTIIDIGKVAFVESHSTSAPKEVLAHYLNQNFTVEKVKQELADTNNSFHIIYHNNVPAGFSKICFSAEHPNIQLKKVTKLERLYLLKEYYGLKLGYQLFQFNVQLSKKQNQTGVWLFVWTENHRAVRFYKKTGFKIVGKHDFEISETHSNPNHQMLLEY
ncbi:MAG: GNAT family N-acetyltransferase [Vicingaceae bacterium]